MPLAKRHCAVLGLVLCAVTVPSQADIYAFVDSKGVRHITNDPNGDSRYKLVMKTPRYKQPATRTAQASSSLGSIITADGQWKLISPQRGSLASVNWGGIGGKPFHVNEHNRRLYTPAITRIATRHGLDPQLVHAVISAESAYNPRAVSSAGAMGLMQLMPATAQRFGVRNAYDPESNIRGGVRYLRWLMNEFDNNLMLALAGYNAGENAVIKYGYKIPPYDETRTYVDRVLRFYNHYRGGIGLSFNQ